MKKENLKHIISYIFFLLATICMVVGVIFWIQQPKSQETWTVASYASTKNKNNKKQSEPFALVVPLPLSTTITDRMANAEVSKNKWDGWQRDPNGSIRFFMKEKTLREAQESICKEIDNVLLDYVLRGGKTKVRDIIYTPDRGGFSVTVSNQCTEAMQKSIADDLQYYAKRYALLHGIGRTYAVIRFIDKDGNIKGVFV